MREEPTPVLAGIRSELDADRKPPVARSWHCSTSPQSPPSSGSRPNDPQRPGGVVRPELTDGSTLRR